MLFLFSIVFKAQKTKIIIFIFSTYLYERKNQFGNIIVDYIDKNTNFVCYEREYGKKMDC